MLLLTPLTTMGSKLIFSAPWHSIRYWRNAEISFSVTPGLMKSNASFSAFSAIRWAAIMQSTSACSFTHRSSINSLAAGTSSWQANFSFQRLYSSTVAYCSSKPSFWMPQALMTSLVRSIRDTLSVLCRISAPVIRLPAASM